MAELVVALDYPEPEQALALAQRLRGSINWLKVGLELFTAAGPSIVARLKEQGFKVFVDLKFMDIPNTARGAVRSVTACGADMCNIHLLGGQAMAKAALEGLAEGAANSASEPTLLGVTLLTSLDAKDLPFAVADGTNAAALVLQLASLGHEWGVHGVVCSGREVADIKQNCGKGFVCLTPGIRIRPCADDQKRTVTPEEAVHLGSDYLVVGRPITRAADPAQAAEGILGRMHSA